MSDQERYFIKHEVLGEQEVTREEYIRAERNAGFRPKSNDPNEIATAAFSSRGVSGHVKYGRSGD